MKKDDSTGKPENPDPPKPGEIHRQEPEERQFTLIKGGKKENKKPSSQKIVNSNKLPPAA